MSVRSVKEVAESLAVVLVIPMTKKLGNWISEDPTSFILVSILVAIILLLIIVFSWKKLRRPRGCLPRKSTFA